MQISTDYKYVKELLRVCDANRDGRVDYQEFRRYMDDKELELYRIFQAIDVEHNGCILPEELYDALVRLVFYHTSPFYLLCNLLPFFHEFYNSVINKNKFKHPSRIVFLSQAFPATASFVISLLDQMKTKDWSSLFPSPIELLISAEILQIVVNDSMLFRHESCRGGGEDRLMYEIEEYDCCGVY
ncbi:unnamed protein product [Lactuca virosa]|uniref:EF-hand domain-containing protein n=1 Tax=Lactuca virosa TaxID=75947 RepID=A0AAU9NQB0_9ASTR|nr:unnamed protein product [Lactuca virosa]